MSAIFSRPCCWALVGVMVLAAVIAGIVVRWVLRNME